MKIVHLSRRYWPSIGGVETHLANLNQHLTEHDLTVITEQFAADLKKSEIHQGVLIKRLAVGQTQRSWSDKIKIWQGIGQNWSLIRQADIIQIHDVFWWLLPFLLLLLDKSVFMTFHGHEGPANPSPQQIFWHWLAAKLTRGNLCVGGFHQQWYHVRPTFITYGAVETTNLMKSPAKSRRNYIYVGRLAEDNHWLEYLQAFKILQSLHRHLHLDIYGDGPLRAAGEKWVKKNRLNATFHGFVDHAKINYHHYQLAFVSRYLAILDALAAATPVVALCRPGIKYDYLAKSPFARWLPIVTNPDQLVEAVQSQPQLPQAAVTWARQQTWTKLTKLYKQLWQI